MTVPRHQHRPQQLQRPAPTFAFRRSDGRGEADLSCFEKRLGDGCDEHGQRPTKNRGKTVVNLWLIYG